MEVNTIEDIDILLGKEADLQPIMYLFDAVKRHMRSIGINQWPHHYPSEHWFEEALNKGEVFVTKENDKISGVFALNLEQDIDYEDITWKYGGNKIYVLHRLAVHPDHQGKGLGKKMLQASIALAKANNGSSMRLDVFSANPTAVRLYQSAGFVQADGHCFFHGHEAPFYCFEMNFND